MAKESRFFHLLLIIVFAVAIVALGAEELRDSYTSKRRDWRNDPRRLLETLKDDPDLDRARISPRIFERRSESDGDDPLIRLDEKSGRDKLDRDDRKELSELVDKLMP